MLLAVTGLARDEGDLLAIGVIQVVAFAAFGAVAGDVAWRLYQAERERMKQSEQRRNQRRGRP